jgi:hypothetical protein
MLPEDRTEARRMVQEIMAWRHKLSHDERTFVHLIEHALEVGRSVAPAEMLMLDQIWDSVVKER